MHLTDTLAHLTSLTVARAAAAGKGSGSDPRQAHRIEAGASTGCSLADAIDAMHREMDGRQSINAPRIRRYISDAHRPTLFRGDGTIVYLD